MIAVFGVLHIAQLLVAGKLELRARDEIVAGLTTDTNSGFLAEQLRGVGVEPVAGFAVLTWWLWALGLAAAASRTQNPVPLLLILAMALSPVALAAPKKEKGGDRTWTHAEFPSFAVDRIAMIPVVVKRNQLLAANSLHIVTLQASFFLGFALP